VVESVKIGWSWPGAIFVGFWALYKKLWGIGTAALAISLAGYAAFGFQLVLAHLIDLGLAISFGAMGNGWRSRDLADRGFERLETAGAKTPGGAIAEHLRNAARDPNGGGRQVPPGQTRPRKTEPTL